MLSLRQTIGWFLRGMPLNPHQQAALVAAVPPAAPRISPRKVTAGQLLRPEYADTREGIILRELMKGYRMSVDNLGFVLRSHGHKVWNASREVSRVRVCLRRSCLVPFSRAVKVERKRYIVLWLSEDQCAVLRKEAARWGA